MILMLLILIDDVNNVDFDCSYKCCWLQLRISILLMIGEDEHNEVPDQGLEDEYNAIS